MKTIIILGGGLSGLAAAEQLADKYRVLILEKEKELGGLARSFNYNGVWIPIAYHHVLNTDKKTIEYIQKYGLIDKLYWNSVNMAFWFNFKQFLLTKPRHILTFAPLSILSRVNLIKLGIYTRLKKDWENLKGIPADRWLTNFVGKEITNKLFKDLAEIKFGDLSSLDAAWLASRLKEAVRTKDKYAYLSCGFQEMIKRIADNIENKGGVIKTNVTVKKIKGNTITVLIDGKQKTFKADKIISSIPPKVLAGISSLPEEISEQLEQIDYKAVICMVFLAKERFLKEYWNIFIEPKLSFGGIFNHSALYPKQIVEGENLYYAFRYISPHEDFYRLSRKKIKNEFIKDIRRLSPSINISWCRIFKIGESEAICSHGYRNLPIKLTDNIYLTGVYKEYPSTRTMHTALESGIKTAELILNEKE